MSEITVHVRLTTAEYRVLERVATKHGTQVHVLIETMCRKSMESLGPRKYDQLTYQVGELACAGRNDLEIATELNVSRDKVRLRRRRLNIASVPVGRPSMIQKEKEQEAA